MLYLDTSLITMGGHFQVAEQFVHQHTLGFRAGDAMHLAIASEQRFRWNFP